MVGSLAFLPKAWRDYGIAKISGSKTEDVASDDPLACMITAAAQYYSTSTPTPKTLTKEELQRLQMPVYVALADHSPITKGSEEMAGLIPDVQIRIWQGTTHSLPMEATAELDAELERFWQFHD